MSISYKYRRSCNVFLADFKKRCSKKVERLGDAAMDAQRHNEAISQYSVALSLRGASPHSLLVKRSTAYTASGLWEEALNDANKVCSAISRGSVLVDV